MSKAFYFGAVLSITGHLIFQIGGRSIRVVAYRLSIDTDLDDFE